MIYDASKQDTGSPKDCIHLLSLHRFIEQIYNEHEAQLKEAKFAITVLNKILELNSELLKAKDEEIERLKAELIEARKFISTLDYIGSNSK